MNWPLFFSTFGLIFLAELPDKTAFATLLLATRKHPMAVFVGVAGAFVAQSLIAVLFGNALSLLPHQAIRIGSGLLFIGFALALWLRKEPSEEELKLGAASRASFSSTIGAAFIIIFIAEWGDLTQLATATLAAQRHNPATIFVSATLALWTVSAIAIIIGHRAKRFINPEFLQRIAAVAFGIVGVAILAAG